MTFTAKLAQLSGLAQKDKVSGFVALIPSILNGSDPATLATDVHSFVDTVVNNDSVGLVVGRQVLAELVKTLGEPGKIKDTELRKRVVEDTLEIIQPKLISYEEQVNLLRFQLADILEAEEEWSEAARVLMGISLERVNSDSEKLRVYVRIVRLLLEEEDSVQAETYQNRAALLVNSSTDRELLLSFKLCAARIRDYGRQFLDAASRYHELSWVGEIDEEERIHMLVASVTCAVLAPAGPNRSRVLASLYRDERTAELPTFSILKKMFLDQILRSTEIQAFEKTLKPHQLARIAISSNDKLSSAVQDDDEDEGGSTRTGPSTVLDRAVMEHNLLASSGIYRNITFRGLGALLDLTPGAAETMARKMIKEGRLRGSIDQVDKLISFEEKVDDNAQGKAGGLGDDVEEAEDTGSPFTKRWDTQIQKTAANVESIVGRITDKNLLKPMQASA